MNFLKKIDHYLLINHPVLWRTKAHYFVLFSLVLGNVVVFGLGYFRIKWYGALDWGNIYTGIWVLIVFGILVWLVSQARNKIKQYRFWDEVLTYSIYALCTASLLVNLMFFGRTSLRTTAQLVSVEQVDIDRALIYSERENTTDYDFFQPNIRTDLPYDVLIEMAERYQLKTSFNKKEIPVKVNEIEGRLDRIYWSQEALNMRKLSPAAIEQLSLICGWQQSMVDVYLRHILLLLGVPVLLFLISHTGLQNILLVVIICTILATISGILGLITAGVFPIILYMILWGIAVQENPETNRIASLSIIPFTLILTWILSDFLFMRVAVDETFSLFLRLLFSITTTALASAYFIKKHFEPSI